MATPTEMAAVNEIFLFIFLYLKISTLVRIVRLKSGHVKKKRHELFQR